MNKATTTESNQADTKNLARLNSFTVASVLQEFWQEASSRRLFRYVMLNYRLPLKLSFVCADLVLAFDTISTIMVRHMWQKSPLAVFVHELRPASAGVLLILFLIFSSAQFSPKRRKFYLKLLECNDVRIINVACEALFATTSLGLSDTVLRASASEALIRLLPLLDQPSLDGFQLKCLYQALNLKKGIVTKQVLRDEILVVTILRALDKVGSAMALKYVQALADGRKSAKNNDYIHEVASECLPKIRDHVSEVSRFSL